MATSYHFQFDLTLADYEAYAAHILKGTYRKSRNYRNIIAVWLIAITALELYTRNFAFTPIYVIVILLALWWILLPLQVKSTARAQVKAIMKTARPGTILGYRDITLTEHELKLSTSLSNEICKWGSIQKVEASPTHVLLFLSDIQAHIIPKREIGTEQAVNELIAFCKVQIERSYNKEEIATHLVN